MNAREGITFDLALESRRRMVRSTLVFMALVALLAVFLYQALPRCCAPFQPASSRRSLLVYTARITMRST